LLEDKNIHVYSYQLLQSVLNIKHMCLTELKSINIIYRVNLIDKKK